MMGKLFGPRQRGGRCRHKPVQLHFEAMESRLLLATFLVSNTNDSGFGSLRQAIVNANLTAGFNYIVFGINSTGMPVIAPASPLPEIKNPVFIDGLSQPGSGLVEISGARAVPGADGLSISAGNSLVAGLAIVKFGGSGIRLTTNGGNTIVADQIGTDPSGESGLGNMGDAVTIVGAPGNTIGGTISQLSNQLSNSGGSGISISGAGATGNVVEGNFIGTNAAFASLGNSGDGVDIVGGVSGNTIGGTVAGAGNTIADNHRFGVEIIDGATSIAVQDNFIAVNALGGIGLNNAPGNTIGGTTPQARNDIILNISSGLEILGAGSTGNLVQGNYIGVDASGTHPEGNVGPGMIIEAPGNTIGGTEVGAGNVISGNGGISLNPTDIGLVILGPVATGNVVQGNFIGTDATGTQSLGNNGDGLDITNAPGNTIGGTVSGAPNVISGNRSDGVRIVSTSQGTATGNVVEGNYIGTDASGAKPLANTVNGVGIIDASGNTIGGTTAAARNILSGNLSDGVFIGTDRSGATATGNVVEGNYIGTDATGATALANASDGVFLSGGASNNTIGGLSSPSNGMLSGPGNLISGNYGNGVDIRGPNATGNLVEGNYIGTDKTGTINVGNLLDGVALLGASGNTIGGVGSPTGNGTLSGPGNLISTNRVGVDIEPDPTVPNSGGSTNNLVEGNYIGTQVNGIFSLGNYEDGIEILGGAKATPTTNNTIGGTTDGARNLISGNLGHGIVIGGSLATGNLVEGNFIGTKYDGSGTNTIGYPLPFLSNGQGGITIENGASGNTVGGLSSSSNGRLSGPGNVISGNETSGIQLTLASGNLVEGNYIGPDVTGSIVIGNTGSGVEIDFFSNNNTIGGTTAAARNIISGNLASGITLQRDAFGNIVQGNFIGTDVTGTKRPLLENTTQTQGNLQNGISFLNFASDNTIGGTVPGAGNIIAGNTGNGVDLSSGSTGNLVLGNKIGVDVTGTILGLGNALNGVFINDVSGNTIGGTGASAGNLISGNVLNGVLISAGTGTTQTSTGGMVQGNTVQGNLIGTDVNGATAIGNGQNGVFLNGSPVNTIGGTTPGAGNLISGNGGDGLTMSGSGVTGNLVQGNYIGTDYSGSSRLPNASNGVLIGSGAFSNTIGGSVGAARNVISGNASNGVDIEGYDNYVEGNYVGTDSTGELTIYSGKYSLGNRVGVLIDGGHGNIVGVLTETKDGSVQGLRNVISGNSEAGVEITNQGAGNEVEGNYLGTNAEGTSIRNPLTNIGLGNDIGVLINGGAMNNTIGGTTSAAVNVISGNFTSGIDISGLAFFGEVPTSSNLVAGNDIGTDKTGTKEMGNGVGVMIEAGARNNTLGGTVRGAPNVITHNYHDGVDVLGTDTSANQILGTDTSANQILGNIIAFNRANGVHLSGAGAKDNTIAGNTIGLDASGNLAGNAVDGVLVDKGATGNTIGGSTETETDYNIIAGNLGGAGVHITDSATKMNCVQGNFIGTDSSGKKSIGNGTGVLINDSTENTIGGTINGSTNPANVIGGNGVGIEISGFNTSLKGTNLIEGNCIGVTEAEDGSPIGNVYGIWINDVPNTMVGGPAQDERNTISDNEWAGVYIFGPDATGNLVEGNSILGRKNKRTKTDPTNPLPIGVFIQNSSSNTIGGAGAGNTIYGNNVGVYIVGTGGTSTGNQVLGNFIGLSANGASRPGNVLYGVILVNAPNNNVPQSGRSANKIVDSGIANFREYSGPIAPTTQSSSGSKAKKPAHHSNHVAHRSPRRTALHAQITVHGHTVPAGPLQKPRARVRH